MSLERWRKRASSCATSMVKSRGSCCSPILAQALQATTVTRNIEGEYIYKDERQWSIAFFVSYVQLLSEKRTGEKRTGVEVRIFERLRVMVESKMVDNSRLVVKEFVTNEPILLHVHFFKKLTKKEEVCTKLKCFLFFQPFVCSDPRIWWVLLTCSNLIACCPAEAKAKSRSGAAASLCIQ